MNLYASDIPKTLAVEQELSGDKRRTPEAHQQLFASAFNDQGERALALLSGCRVQLHPALCPDRCREHEQRQKQEPRPSARAHGSAGQHCYLSLILTAELAAFAMARLPILVYTCRMVNLIKFTARFRKTPRSQHSPISVWIFDEVGSENSFRARQIGLPLLTPVLGPEKRNAQPQARTQGHTSRQIASGAHAASLFGWSRRLSPARRQERS